VQLFRGLDELPGPLLGGAVSVGNFDGVHLGHARIVAELKQAAAAIGGPAVVFTFDPHPVRLLRPEKCPPPMTWTDRKAELLGELGVDAMVAYPTDQALLELTADEFFRRIIQGALNARAMVEGPNFCFGRGREGDIERLRGLTAAADVTLVIVEPLRVEWERVDGEVVSSSLVRRLIAEGDVRRAAELMTRPYRIRGMVTHGAKRGAGLGFPTANLEAVDTLLPGQGVYAGVGRVAGRQWPAAVNVGPNPTFAEGTLKVEVHLVGFRGDLYGQPLEVDFLRRLRDIRTFAGVEELKSQLAADVQRARAIAAETPPNP
jgi:riboflavin kinase/FMN adenylyltransferase